ncbi:tyrosine-type recombinase/integrase [Paracidovorax cattleyae]|uniref:tyrosine-type recombinase/integrase n=1 Tax=Paracidovorax cattleyae TaxID=80868 RepID=UPI0018AF8F2C|nr:integrase family protein [Paracidovorax cattleyae]MBF9263912.1 integrase family protein [Paracidovorax cattleyae]
MHFDARTAKLLKPGEHIIVEASPGLRLVATDSRRTWTYRYKSPVDGRMRQVSIGQWPAMSLAAATAEWEKLRIRRDAGEDVAATKRASRKALEKAAPRRYTVRALCDDYMAGHVRQRRKKKGQDEVARMFDRHLGELASMLPEEVTRADAFSLLEHMASTPVAAANLRRELGGAWDYALDAGRIDQNVPNWWRQVMRGRLRSKGKRREGKNVGTAKRVLSPAELSVLIPWLPNFSELTADVLVLYLWTCARGAEIVAIHSSEVSEEADGLWWTCPKAKTKNARHEGATDFRVPLVGRAEQVVRRRLDSLDGRKAYLFPARSKTGHSTQNGIQSMVHYRQPYCRTEPDVVRERLPVTHWSPHDLRRTGRTLLASLGCPDDVGEAIMGHIKPGVRGIYNLHRYDSERRLWLGRLAQRLEEIVTGQPSTRT